MNNPSTTAGVRLLCIDWTGNKLGFERVLSDSIFSKLRSGGPTLVTQEVVRPVDGQELEPFGNPGADFNAVFLMAHGGPDPGDGNVSSVSTNTEKSNWYHFAGLFPDLRNKLVCLAVCYGSCKDAAEAFLKEDHFAFGLVAPTTKLSKSEADNFFPAFFLDLQQAPAHFPNPETVEQCVAKNNHLANHKMKFDSPFKKHD